MLKLKQMNNLAMQGFFFLTIKNILNQNRERIEQAIAIMMAH